jgi:hypothetical protein
MLKTNLSLESIVTVNAGRRIGTPIETQRLAAFSLKDKQKVEPARLARLRFRMSGSQNLLGPSFYHAELKSSKS